MTVNPGASDDLAERTCHTVRLGRKIVGVACDKRIVTAVAPRAVIPGKAGMTVGDDWVANSSP